MAVTLDFENIVGGVAGITPQGFEQGFYFSTLESDFVPVEPNPSGLADQWIGGQTPWIFAIIPDIPETTFDVSQFNFISTTAANIPDATLSYIDGAGTIVTVPFVFTGGLEVPVTLTGFDDVRSFAFAAESPSFAADAFVDNVVLEDIKLGTLVVTTTADEAYDGAGDIFDGDGLSLREAIGYANAFGGADLITFDPTVFNGGASSLIRLTQGELEITDEVTIDGSTGTDIVITGDANNDDITVGTTDITDVAASVPGRIEDASSRMDDNSRIFDISDTASLVSLNGLTLTGGTFIDDGNVEPLDGGGAIRSQSTLEVSNSTISGNTSVGVSADGGGIHVSGDFSVTNSTISNNRTGGTNAKGGGVFVQNGTFSAFESTISGNSTQSNSGDGGGISGEAVNLVNTTVSGNSTRGVDADGGGIFATGLTLTNSTVSGNSTLGRDSDGGGITAQSLVSNNSIILGNTDLQSGSDEISISGTTTFNGGNIVGGDQTAFNTSGLSNVINAAAADVFAQVEDNNGVDAGALALNGGSVETIALKGNGSNPALDAGQDTLISRPTDARGETREIDLDGVANNGSNTVDLGAFELQGIPEAPSLIVTTNLDVVDAFDGLTSLREAIAFANDTAAGNLGDGDADNDGFANDTITFDPSLSGGVIHLAGGTLRITSDVTIEGDIDGDDAPDITLSGDAGENDTTTTDANGNTITDVNSNTNISDNVRVVSITNAIVDLNGLVITGGRATDGFGGGGIQNGNAFGGSGTLTISNSSISGNRAPSNSGGGIENFDDLTVINTLISRNEARSGGGILNRGDADLINTTLSNNSAREGGGLYNDGTATLTNSTLAGNSANDGGGLFNSYDVSLTNTTISGNSATYFGGGLFNGGDASLINTTISGNSASDGGGIYDVDTTNLTNSIVLGNEGSSSREIEASFSTTYAGLNIIGEGADTNGSDGVINAAATDVFADTYNNNGVQAGVLADNGGPVQTIALKSDASNPALDAGDDNLAVDDQNLALVTDARGEDRTVDLGGVANNGTNTVDLGAFELQGIPEAPSLIVTTNLDVVDAFDGLTSLREAIAFANDTTAGNLGDGDADNDGNANDTITFADSLGAATIVLGGSDLDITSDITIEGGGDITVSGNNTSRVFHINDGASIINALTVTDGYEASAPGGGIYVGAASTASLTLNNSTVSQNKSGSSDGGGIYVRRAALELNGSTITDNDAANGSGGGIAVQGASASMSATNTTISGNTAQVGGAISATIPVSLSHVTISDNKASGTVGGIISGGAELHNSLVLGNEGSQLSGPVTLLGGNIVREEFSIDGVVSGTGITTLDVFETGTLADNGGPVQTIALKSDVSNPALDAGDDSLAVDDQNVALTTDARGEDRTVDLDGVANNGTNTVDLGAFELQELPEAPSLIVTTNLDVVDEFDGLTSLREAVAYSQTLTGTNTVTFSDEKGAFTDDASSLIRFIGGQIRITKSVTIDGSTTDSNIVITGDRSGNDQLVPGTYHTDVSSSSMGDNISMFYVAANDGVTTFDSLTLTGGRDRGFGGGAVFGESDVHVLNSNVIGNASSDSGGGLSIDGIVLVENSSIIGNVTSGSYAYGGGINTFRLTAINSTIADNKTTGYYSAGGGISAFNVTLINSTVTGNSTTNDKAVGGGIDALSSKITNSIVLGNVTAAPGVGGDEIIGGRQLFGNNILGNASAEDVFEVTVDNNGVLAGGVANNGGRILTVALKADASNPALDTGDDSLAVDSQNVALISDARGEERFEDLDGVANNGANTVDLGAFELQGIPEAPSLIVTTNLDVVDAFDGLTSLREAIAFANDTEAGNLGDGDADNDGFANDTITFDPSVFDGNQGDIDLVLGQLEITSDVTIDGDSSGASNVRIDGQGASRVLHIGEGLTIALDNLAIMGGATQAGDFRGGGGILIERNTIIEIQHSLITGNTALAGARPDGGGIYLSNGGESVLTLNYSAVSGNAADGVGGGILVGDGAAIHVANSEIFGNLAGSDGGGIRGVEENLIELVDTIVEGNSAGGDGGGIGLVEDAILLLTNSTVQGNFAGTDGAGLGGGVYANDTVVTISNTLVDGNSAPDGGGIATRSTSLFVVGSTISGNSASDGDGGGLRSRGETIFRDSTISGNTATEEGGGIDHQDNPLTLINTTVSGNTAGRLGGGIYNEESAELQVIQSTITNNAAGIRGSGIFQSAGFNSASFANSVVAGNFDGDDLYAPDSAITSLGHNLIGNGDDSGGTFVNGVNGDIVGTVSALIDPLLGDLSDNGGPTQTHLPLSGSPLIDAGNIALALDENNDPLTVDQRGFDRTAGPSVDIGAAEFGASPAEAPQLTVTTTLDVVDEFDGLTSLREALAYANETFDADGDGTQTDTVTFDPTVFDGEAQDIIYLTSGFELRAAGVVIDGDANGATGVTISGDVDMDDATTTDSLGNRITDISANSNTDDNVRVFVNNGGYVAIDALTITGGVSAVEGAAFSSFGSEGISISNSSLSGNISRDGGALFHLGGSGSTFSAQNTLFESNYASDGGGAIFSFGDVTLDGVTLANNSTAGSGGGLYQAESTATLVNTTVSGNSAQSGGGLYNTVDGDLEITNSTISGNAASSSGGGIYSAADTSSVSVANSLILGNYAPADAEISGNYTADGPNITGGEDPADIFASTVSIDGGVTAGALSDNGGPVPTIALKSDATNPALDAGDDSLAVDDQNLALTTDARGEERFEDLDGIANNGTNTVDLGAFELLQGELTPPNPSLSVVKTADVASVDEVGDVITYSFAVTNTGNVVLSNVVLSDDMVDGGAPVFVDGDTNTNGLLDLTETWTYSATYTVSQEDIDAGAELVNVVTASSDEVADTTGTATVTVDQTFGLTIAKIVNDLDGANDGILNAAGDTIEYYITTTNTGNVTLTDVTVTDPLTGLDVMIGDLAPGDFDTQTTVYTLTQDDLDTNGGGDGGIDNVATADSDETDAVTATVTVPIDATAGLMLDKVGVLNDGGDGVQAGDTVDYSFTVSNTGNVTLTGVVLDDPLITVVRGADTTGDDDTDLEVGEVWSFTGSYVLTQADIDAGFPAGRVDNTATVTTTQGVSDTDSDSVSFGPAAGIVIAKTVLDVGGDGAVGVANEAGDVIRYQIVTANTGDVTLTGVTITDPLTGLSEAIGTLAVGASDTRTTTYTVTLDDLNGNGVDTLGAPDGDGDVDNTVTVDSDQTDPVSSSVAVPVRIPSVLSIAANAADQAEGDVGTTPFTFTVTRAVNTTGTTTVTYTVSGSGADPAQADDFAGGFINDTVTFLDGEATQTVTVNVAGDIVLESDEGFTVTLSDPSAGGVIETASADGIIRNDDTGATRVAAIVAADADKAEGDTGLTAFTFDIYRLGETSGTATVAWRVVLPDEADIFDFGNVTPSNTVVFQDGESVQTITVNVSGDVDPELDEAFEVELFAASQMAISQSQGSATGIIRNDDDGTPEPVDICFVLIDAQTDEEIVELTNGATIDRTALTDGTFSIEARVKGTDEDESIRFSLDGDLLRVENVEPYTAFGDTQSSGDYWPDTLPQTGDFTLTAEVFTEDGASGTELYEEALVFSVIDGPATPVSTFSITPTDAVKDEGDTGTTTYTFTVTRSGSTDGPASLSYAVSGAGDDPADGDDFGGAFPVGQVDFSDGETSATITVSVSGDTDDEADEGFLVTLDQIIDLNDLAEGSITDATAGGTILNDDGDIGGGPGTGVEIDVASAWINGQTSVGFRGSITLTNDTGADQTEFDLDLDLAGFDIQSLWVQSLPVQPMIDVANGIVDLEPTGNPWWQPVIEDGDSFTINFVAQNGGPDALTAFQSGQDAFDDFVDTTAVSSLSFEWGV